MLNRPSIKSALKAWKLAAKLGQHPLATLRIVQAWRIEAGYPDTPIGYGSALRDVLSRGIESLRPTSDPPDFSDERWRLYIILTEQYVNDRLPDYVTQQLGLARNTYNHVQAKALDTLVAILLEQEEIASLRDQPQPKTDPVTEDQAPEDVNTGETALPARANKARRLSPRLVWPLLALAVVLIGLVWFRAWQQTAGSRPVIASLSLGPTRPSFISANPITQRVYVAQEDLPGIAVIDSATHTVLATIPTQGYHRGIAVNPITNRIYVAQQFEGSVRVINGADNTVITDLVSPGLIHTIGDVAINPVTNRLYVVRANNNDVAVFDAHTHAFLGAVAFGPPSAMGCPVIACDSNGIAVNPATNRIYVANPSSDRLTVIDGANNRVLTTISVGKSPSQIGVNPVTNTLYVSNGDESSVSVINGMSHRVVATIPVEMTPLGVAVNPSTNHVYVANSGGKTISVIDGAANSVVRTITLDVPPIFTTLIPNRSQIYVTSNRVDDVKVIEDIAPFFAAWTPLGTTGGPPAPRGDTASRPLGYDAVNNRVMFFGGMRGGALLNDTWVLVDADGTTGTPQWIELVTESTPPPRRSHAGAYDAINNRLMTYGGCLGGCTPIDNQVYVLSHANGLGGAPAWQKLNPANNPPPPRNGHSAVYDPTSNRLIVFGGDNCCGKRYNDTWVLTHANGLGDTPVWLPLTPNGGPPPERLAHSAVYDVANNRMIVFGGTRSSDVLNDTWVLSNANGMGGTPIWSQLTPSGALPVARSGHSAVYNQDAGQMLVFGGINASDLRSDTWSLTYANGLSGTPVWTQAMPLGTAPPTRTSSNMVYHATTNRLILFGGDTLSGPLNDTWLLVNAFPPRR